jgi:hypothetical protein
MAGKIDKNPIKTGSVEGLQVESKPQFGNTRPEVLTKTFL